MRVLALICMCQLCCPSHGKKVIREGLVFLYLDELLCSGLQSISLVSQSVVGKNLFAGLTVALLNVTLCHSRCGYQDSPPFISTNSHLLLLLHIKLTEEDDLSLNGLSTCFSHYFTLCARFFLFFRQLWLCWEPQLIFGC